MHFKTSYRQILSISLPIMIGSAAQNVIALSDSVLLYHKSQDDFAAIGVVGIFYLIIAAIGYGFSKGGQIIIARRAGAKQYASIGQAFYNLLFFELVLSCFMYVILRWGSPYIFAAIIDDPKVYALSLEYLSQRSWGVFFSYMGVAIIALYTGIGRTMFILIDTLILAIVNLILNYLFIFGHFGFPEMGIAGAGLASSMAEAIAFIVFVVYMFFDKQAKQLRLRKFPRWHLPLIKQLSKLSMPMVAQSIVGLGSWFLFFGFVDNMGPRALAVTNLVRMVYLVLSIPTWGFAAGVNTLVSGFIGAKKRQAVIPMIWKTAKLNLLVTMILAVPVVFFPETILYPILGGQDMSLIVEAKPIFYTLLGILVTFAIGGVMFNGLSGTGAVNFGLALQFVCALFYTIAVYIIIVVANTHSLPLAWSIEGFYWILMILVMVWYLNSKRWHKYVF